MTHGYGSDTGWLFQKICINVATWGYAVFASCLLGHCRSDGLRCYLGYLEKVAAVSLHSFSHVREREPYKDLPAFLFGEFDGWGSNDAHVLTVQACIVGRPDLLCDIVRDAQAHEAQQGAAVCGVADKWASMPYNKMVGKAIEDPEKLKIIVSNPRRYTKKPRVGTMRGLSLACQYIRDNCSRPTIPFLTAHGTADGVTCPTSSQLLYEKTSSEDKTRKIGGA